MAGEAARKAHAGGIEPAFRIAWRLADGSASCSDLPLPVGEAQAFATETVEEDGVWHLRVLAGTAVEILSVTAILPLDIASAEALFLNGYNSWTDSCERPPLDAMPGLMKTPRPIISHWVLDASGDYRFVRQDMRPGHQHGVGYGYLRRGSETVLFGECTPDAGVAAIYEDADAGTITIEKEGPGGPLPAGECREVFALFLGKGTLEDAFGRYMHAMGVVPRPAAPLVGFSSWYRHYGDIDAGKLAHDLEGVAAALAELPDTGVRPIFQIDDGYAKVGDWTAPDKERFPGGMAPLASRIAGKGLLPGLWMAPFVCERGSETYRQHPGWLLRDAEGAPVMSGSHWSGGFALDTLNPDVREHVRQALGTATREWGFRFLKLDFLYAAALLPHGGMNRGELMADALDLLRESVPQGTLFDLCGVPIMSAIGRTEYCRIGCDVGLDWDGKAYMRITGRERVSTKNSLANTLGRAHLNGVAFLADPDVFFLRDDVKLTDTQKEELLLADARLGGMLLTSDDMGAWGRGQKDAFLQAFEIFCSRYRDFAVPEPETGKR